MATGIELLRSAQEEINNGNLDKAREFRDQYEQLNNPTTQPEPVQEEGTTVLENIAEIPEAVVKGVGSSIKESGEFLESIIPLGGVAITGEGDDDRLKSFQDENGVHLFSMFGKKISYMKPDEWSDLQALNANNLVDMDHLFPTRDDGFDTPTAEFVAPVAQFVTGFVGAGKFLKPFQAATTTGKIVKATAQGAMADAVVFDPHEARLSNLAQHFGIETALTDYLAADPDDSDAEGRFKNAVEGSIIGLSFELVFKLARATKKAKDAKNENINGNTEKADSLMKEVADEVEEAEQLIPLKEDAATFKGEAKVEPSKPENIEVKGVDTEPKIVERDTRGQGQQYHGTSTELGKLGEGYDSYSSMNIYGQGFYTTDALDVAGGYSKKGKGGNPTRYRVIKTKNAKLYDLDQPLNDETIDMLSETTEFNREWLEDLPANPTVRDVFDDLREWSGSEGIPADEVQEMFDGFKYLLEQKGFQGYSHKGGGFTNTKEHHVEIFWNPKEHIKLEKIETLNTKPKEDVNKPENIEVKGVTEEATIPKTKEGLDEATKEARAESGSLRTGDEVITVPVATAVKKGQALISKLIKDPEFNKGSLIDYVKGLKELTTDSTFYMGVRSLGDTILKAHDDLVNTAAYKAGDVETVRKANELAQAFQQTYAYHKGLLSESGRIMRYSQDDINAMPSDLLALDGQALSQAITNAAKTNPRNARFVDKFKNRMEQFNEYYVGNLLLSWKTQATNLMANTIIPLIDVFEQAGGGLIGLARGDKTQLVDAARQFYGYGKYAGTSLRAGWEALQTAKNVLDPEFKVREEVDGQVDRIAVGTKEIDLRKLSWEEAKNTPFSDWVGNLFRLSFRGLAAGDEIFKQLTFRSVAYREIVKKWKAEGKYKDKDTKTFDALVEKAVDDAVLDAIKMQKDKSVVNPIVETALKRARENTFTEPLGSFGKDIQVFVNKYPPLRLIAPFVRTPINVFKMPLRRAMPFMSKRQKEMWEKGGAPRDRVIFETGYMMLALYLLQQAIEEKIPFEDEKGNVTEVYRFQSTWSAMSYNAQSNKRLTGITPHSAFINGEFRSTRRFDPADTVITTLTGIRDLREAGKYAEADEMGLAIAASFINLGQNKTFMQGVTTFVEAMNSPENFAASYAEGFARSLTPQLVTMFNDDPYYREAQGLYENFISKVPSLSEKLPPKRDILGQPILRPEDGLAPSSLVTNNVVRLEFNNIQSSIAEIPEKEDNGILNWKDERYVMGGVTAYDRYSELVGKVKIKGKTVEQSLEKLIESNDYKTRATTSSIFSDASYKGSKESAILSVVTAYRNQAKKQVLEEYERTGIIAVFEQHQINKKAALDKKYADKVETDVDKIIQQYKTNQ